MGMLGAFVDFELLEHLATQLGLGQHAADRQAVEFLGVVLQHVGELVALGASEVSAMSEILFVLKLVPAEERFLGVDDHHVVAAVDVGGEGGLVLAPQVGGGFGEDASEGLPFRIDQVPVALNLMRLDDFGHFHDRFLVWFPRQNRLVSGIVAGNP